MSLILAIEASGLVASVALVNEEKVLAEYSINTKLTHSQTILPMIDEVVKRTGTDLNAIDAIAVSGGPGSFTGLRIGSATAKGLGFALNKKIVSVPTTETIASNIYGFSGVICPLMDARRSQVYTGIYKNGPDGFKVIKDKIAVPIADIVNEINNIGEPVMYLGDGVPVFKDYLTENTKVSFLFAPNNISMQRAGALGVRALKLFAEGKAVNAEDHVPDYLRLSQAEREKLEGKKGE